MNLGSPFLLTRVTGQIAAEPSGYPSRYLAVAVNGTVGAVTETSPGASEFSALVPETAFLPGRNDVENSSLRKSAGRRAWNVFPGNPIRLIP